MITFKNTFLTYCLILFSSSIFCQKETVHSIFLKADEIIDSTERQDFLEDQIWSFRVNDVKLALKLIDSVAVERGGVESLPDHSRLVYYYGVLYKNDSQFDKSEASFLRYRAYFEPKNDSLRLSGVNNTLGSLMFDQAKYGESMAYYKQALNYTSNGKNPKYRLVSLARMGNIMDELGRFENSKIYFRESLALAEELKDSFEIGNSLMNQGLSFEKQQLTDSAYVEYSKAEKYWNRIGAKVPMVYLNSNMAVVLDQKKEYAGMKVRASRAYEDALEIGNQKMAIISSMQIGLADVQLGNINQGINRLEEVLQSESNALVNKRKKDIHKALYQAFKKKGQLAKALKHYEEFHENAESVLNEDIAAQVNNLERSFDTERKENEINNLTLADQLNNQKINNQRNFIFLLISGLILLSGLGFLLWRQRNRIKKQNVVVNQALADREVLLKEIHHRVKNNLQLVSSLLTLQSRKLTDEKAVEALEAGKSRVRSMALIHQDLYSSGNLKGISVQKYLESLCKELFYAYNINDEDIDLNLEIEDLNLDIDTLVPLGLIINELVINAIKHAYTEDGKGKLLIKLHVHDERLNLVVEDNGNGVDLNTFKNSNSFGNKLIYTLLNQLDGSLEILNKNGSRFDLSFKDYRIAS